MDQAKAACHSNPGAYRLAFSPRAEDAVKMVADYCYHCPVRIQCLVEAIDHNYYGVWGGRTRAQRLELLQIQRAFNS